MSNTAEADAAEATSAIEAPDTVETTNAAEAKVNGTVEAVWDQKGRLRLQCILAIEDTPEIPKQMLFV